MSHRRGTRGPSTPIPAPGRSGGGARLRITGGSFCGRHLRVPPYGVRPTSDRVRESLFARLTRLDGARVLDLFAGSGALGMEALSRGAARAVFVDVEAASVAVVRANLETLQLTDRTQVIRSEWRAALGRLARAEERFDLVLLDPPYDSEELLPALVQLVDSNLLVEDGMVVVETAKRHPPIAVAGLSRLDEREYGDTRLTRLVGEACST